MKMSHRIVVLLVAAIAVSSGDAVRLPAVADEVVRPQLVPATPTRTVQFRDRLIFGLRARLKSEIEFIDRVVMAVETGQLPERMVDQTFFWARQRSTMARNGRPRRPIIYFQFALTERAKRIGVTL